MDINEKISKAKAREDEKGRPSKVVTVSLDADVSERLNELQAALEAEKQKRQDGRLAKESPIAKLLKQIDETQAEFADTLVDLKFTRMIGNDWSDLVITNPPREDSLPDMVVFGYNFHAVTRAAAVKSGRALAGTDDEVGTEMSEEQWDDLFQLMAGGDHETIANAVYSLNEGDSNRAVELGKAQRASAKK
jgi:hypothetical protein